jgi:hypothetical protein
MVPPAGVKRSISAAPQGPALVAVSKRFSAAKIKSSSVCEGRPHGAPLVFLA